MRTPRFLFAGILAVLITCTGCSNPIIKPRTARQTSSKERGFPYMLRIELVQKMRFNVHQFRPANADIPMECFVMLRRDSGTLTTGDFYVGSLGSTSPMPTRGTVVFSGNRVQITAELARDADPTKGWEALLANGDYLLTKE